MFPVEQSHVRRRSSLVIAVISALVLVAVTVVAMRHGSTPKRVVVLPLATTNVACGQTITTSIIVGNDLACASGNGLVVGAASITINLNGHTLAGTTGGSGVLVNTGFTGVTVENGTVSGWAWGVDTTSSATKITGIRATDNNIGIVTLGPASTVTGNVVFLNRNYGIDAGGGNTLVSNNAVRQSGSWGIVVGAGGSSVATNQVENNGANGIIDQGTGNVLTGNVANANGTAGTYDGIDSQSDHAATVKANTANYNTSFGIEVYAGTTDGGGNTAKGNTQATQCKDVVCS